MKFTTKPTGIHATFEVECGDCRALITVTNGRTDHNVCRTYPDWSTALQAYYESGANGAPPKHPLDDRR